MIPTIQAKRVAVGHSGTELWEQNGEVYAVHVSPKIPLQFDTLGYIMGRRWECSREHFDRNKHVYANYYGYKLTESAQHPIPAA